MPLFPLGISDLLRDGLLTPDEHRQILDFCDGGHYPFGLFEELDKRVARRETLECLGEYIVWAGRWTGYAA